MEPLPLSLGPLWGKLLLPALRGSPLLSGGDLGVHPVVLVAGGRQPVAPGTRRTAAPFRRDADSLDVRPRRGGARADLLRPRAARSSQPNRSGGAAHRRAALDAIARGGRRAGRSAPAAATGGALA